MNNRIIFFLKKYEPHVGFYNQILWRVFPSKLYISYRFKKTFGFSLNLSDPKTFNEKLNWKKYFDRNPLYSVCADKFAVRQFVARKLGSGVLIPLQAHARNVGDINFNDLNKPYIIKSTHGTAQLIIVREEATIDIVSLKKEVGKWLKTNLYHSTKEWHYKNILPAFIVEDLLADEVGNVPKDYKFHCFSGGVEFIEVDIDRFTDMKKGFYDKNWKPLPFNLSSSVGDKPRYGIGFSNKPDTLTEMIRIAETISKEFDYVRVDLYELNLKVFFGELTFIPGAGFMKFFPDKYDLIYGGKIILKKL